MTETTILDLTIRVTLILLAATAAAILLRRSSAAARHLVGVLGLGAVLALPFAAGVLPAWNVSVPGLDAHGVLPPATRPPALRSNPLDGDGTAGAHLRTRSEQPVSLEPAATDVRLAALRLPAAPVDRVAPADDLSGSSFAPEASPGPAAATTAAGPAPFWTSGLGRTLIALLWLGGAAFLLARLSAGWLRMARLSHASMPLADGPLADLARDCSSRLGLAAPPSVRVSRELRVPVLWGVIRPQLLLPETACRWSTGRLRVVLLHELAHLRRRDGVALLVGRVAAALWWFHPMVWVVERHVRQDCERACDDLVLGSGERASDYARHLLEVARELPRRAPSPAAALSVLGAGRLERRLHSILAPRAARRLRPAAALTLALAVAATFAVVATVQPTARAAAGLQSVEEPFPIPAPMLEAEPHSASASEPMPALRTQPGSEPTRAGVVTARWDRADKRDYREGKDVYDHAHDLHRDERWADAAAEFERAASLGFRPGTSLYNAACGYARMGQAGRAVELLRESIFGNGFDAASLIRRDDDLDPIRGDETFKNLLDELDTEGMLRGDRKYGAAVDRYRAMLDRAQSGRDDYDGGDWYSIGSELLSMREFDLAIDSLQRAVDLLKTDANAHYNLACAHSLRGDLSAAATELEAAVYAGFDSDERFENDSDLSNLRGTQEFDRIREIHDFLSLDRFQRGDRNWFGHQSNYSETRWKPAIEEYSTYVKTHPGVGRAWSNLGWALHFSHRHAEARDAFLKQLDLDYRPGTAAYNVGCTYAMEGNTDEAFRWLRRALEDHDFASAGQIAGDEDLESLRSDPRFEQLLRDAHAAEGERDGHDGDHVLRLIEKLRDKAADWL